MIIAVEVWTIEETDCEEPQETELVDIGEFMSALEAREWAWNRMEEGFFTRIWRR